MILPDDEIIVVCNRCTDKTESHGGLRMDSTQKFNNLADNYTAGRPDYSDAFVESLYSKYGFSKQSVIADIGSGTGKFARQLLQKGSFVYCVEPNGDMRNTSIEELSGYKGFRAINGNADETKLNEESVDFITTAQAFHWFDVDSFKRESRRILRNNKMVFLIWNIRDMSAGINQDSFKIYSKFCPNFKGFNGGIRKDDIRIRQYFDNRYEYVEFDNPLYYNKDNFISRSLSGSYSLRKEDKDYSKFLNELNKLFDKYAKNQMVTMENKTVAYIGRID